MSSIPDRQPPVRISGDLLALDPVIREQINTEAEKLQKRYPTTPVVLRIGISEEFDQARGHRIRCELAADLPGRRRLMVREAQKEAVAAIAAAFAAAKKQIRRLSVRTPAPRPRSAAGGLPVAGA